MFEIKLKSTETFSAVAPIRYSITFSTDKRIFAFSSVNDICFAFSECLENPSSKGIILTIPLKNPAACLSFVKNEKIQDSDKLLVIDSAGQLHVFDVKLEDNKKLNVTEIETGQPVDLPSDFCHGQTIHEDKVYFWCRRNVIFCRKHENSNIQQFSLKADIKCFDSLVLDNLIFCVVGCVNGNVHFLEVDTTEKDFIFTLVGLVIPAPVPVTNVAMKKINNSIITVFNHGTKVTAVSWESAESFSKDISSLKIKRQLEMGGKHWFLSTDSVIGDFTSDISSLVFAKEKNRLLIVTNERDFGVYDYKEDSENCGRFNWINVMLGGEAAERPFGYCGGVFAPSEERIVIYNTRGAILPFTMDKKGKNFYVAVETAPPFNGHLSSITGAHWDPTGTLLFTAGSRSREIHTLAPIKDGTICQIARPESHQYDIQCFAVVSGLTLIVGSDELPFRVYRASANYVESMKNLVGLEAEKLKKNEKSLPTTPFFKQAVLGVLNVAAGDSQTDDEDHFGMVFTERPTINSLMRFTYWEVAESLYGHPNPSATLAIDSEAKFLATSCHATSPEDAVIFLRETTNWNIIERLSAHSLTVTKMAFSPNGKWLLSVSRDRSFAIFSKENNWQLMSKILEAHARMIFACSWTADSNMFLTASRDGQLYSWSKPEKEKPVRLGSIKLPAAVYTVTIAPTFIIKNSRSKWLTAAGLADGSVQFYLLDSETGDLEHLSAGSEFSAFSLPVTCLEFRQQTGPWELQVGEKQQNDQFLLAAGSENGIVKVFSLFLDNVNN